MAEPPFGLEPETPYKDYTDQQLRSVWNQLTGNSERDPQHISALVAEVISPQNREERQILEVHKELRGRGMV